MSTITAACAALPRGCNRMRMRMVEDLDDPRDFASVFRRVAALCESVHCVPIGFRLSGFVVTPKLVVQVLYSLAAALFLVLAGRGGTRV